ncbi:unnamed protein product [Tuber melanosporum]|uniref:(Perigord truffle) hypothetical protein n=1 Tax=Tuber melanosporum (strain Mel28) TaxID=656061 RepID=D5G6L8_TUBMM|nr:uncharacterized protein GSTUM_00002102001 [Tuber melanosporum]CAZ80161.1 unnamed protein product [Tuber melanosporum]
MGSVQGPPSFIDIFDTFINKDCYLSEVPNSLNSRETTPRDGRLHQQQQPHPQELSPPPTPKAGGASSADAQPHPDLSLEFSESHFLGIKTTDLPPWKDPFDLSNFDLATTHAVNDLLATATESTPRVLVAPIQHTPPNATPGNSPRSPAQHYILPPTPLSLPPSTTTSPAPAVLPPPSTAHCTPTPTPATTTTPSTAATSSPKPRPKPRPKKTSPCTSAHCHSTATTQNPEATHHHHYKDSKHRFCCRHKDCASCTSYTTRKDRNRHEVSKHSDQHLICDVCGHTTAREDNMRVHVRAAHREGWEVIMERIVGVRVRMVMGFQ